MAEGIPRRTFISFTGFDDDDADFENFAAEEPAASSPLKIGGEKKRRRGGRRNRQRNALKESPSSQKDEKHQTGEIVEKQNQQQQQNSQKQSRLIEELHQRERVRGMNRLEARQLLHDKLLFRGETDLSEIRLRRFCIVIPSKDLFTLEDGSTIPDEILSISMENSRISSVLRLVPSYEEENQQKGNHLSEIDRKEKFRMKTVFWNPGKLRNSNMMLKTWSYFLDRSMHSLLLVPLTQQTVLLEFLRKLNEIRSILNKRATVSICLSRVITIEDFLICMQNLADSYTTVDSAPHRKTLSNLNFGVALCQYFIKSMRDITKVSLESRKQMKLSPFDEWNQTEDGLLLGPPPGLSAQVVRSCDYGAQTMFYGSNYVDPYVELQNFDQFLQNSNSYVNGAMGNNNMQRTRQQFYSQPDYFNDGAFNANQRGTSICDKFMAYGQKMAPAGSRNENLAVANNNNLNCHGYEGFLTVTTFRRILKWVNEIDFGNMNSFEELEQKYELGDGDPGDDDDTYSEFEYID